MGPRLFKQLLEALEEDVSGLPFIDILYKMEKLNLLKNAKDWVKLRQTRNNIAHEYPFYKEVQIEELNLLPEEVERLIEIWKKLEIYSKGLLQFEPETLNPKLYTLNPLCSLPSALCNNFTI